MSLSDNTAQQSLFLSQILYPAEALTSITSHAFLVGWNVESFRCCICCAIELPVDSLHLLQSALSNGTHHLEHIFRPCSRSGKSRPVILGEWTPTVKGSDLVPLSVCRGADMWITLTLDVESSSDKETRLPSQGEGHKDIEEGILEGGKGGGWDGNGERERHRSLQLTPRQRAGAQPKLYSVYSLGCAYQTSCYMIQYTQIDTDRLSCLNLGTEGNLTKEDYKINSRPDTTNGPNANIPASTLHSTKTSKSASASILFSYSSSASLSVGSLPSLSQHSPPPTPPGMKGHSSLSQTPEEARDSSISTTPHMPPSPFSALSSSSSYNAYPNPSVSERIDSTNDQNTIRQSTGVDEPSADHLGIGIGIGIGTETTHTLEFIPDEATDRTDLHIIASQINSSHDLKNAIVLYLSEHMLREQELLVKKYNASNYSDDAIIRQLNLSSKASKSKPFFYRYRRRSCYDWLITLLWSPILWTMLMLSWLWFRLSRLFRQIAAREIKIFFLNKPVSYWLGVSLLDNYQEKENVGKSYHQTKGDRAKSSSSDENSPSSSIPLFSATPSSSSSSMPSDNKSINLQKNTRKSTSFFDEWSADVSSMSSGRHQVVQGDSMHLSAKDVFLTSTHIVERFVSTENCLYRCSRFPRSWSFPVMIRQRLWIAVMSHIAYVWVDMCLGCLAGYLLYTKCDQILKIAKHVGEWGEETFLLSSLKAFNNAPGGIKFNPLITHKLGKMLSWAVKLSGKVFARIEPFYGIVVKLVACSGTLGITMQLSMLIDILRVCSLHVTLLYRVLAIQHLFQLELLASLWHLFQGRKWNVLRKRVDTCMYDKHQLLFGTMLFSIVFFLFPSFAAYFYLFALCQLLVVTAQTILWALKMGIKGFPYYQLSSYVWDAYNFTAGIQFELNYDQNRNRHGEEGSIVSSIDGKDDYKHAAAMEGGREYGDVIVEQGREGKAAGNTSIKHEDGNNVRSMSSSRNKVSASHFKGNMSYNSHSHRQGSEMDGQVHYNANANRMFSKKANDSTFNDPPLVMSSSPITTHSRASDTHSLHAHRGNNQRGSSAMGKAATTPALMMSGTSVSAGSGHSKIKDAIRAALVSQHAEGLHRISSSSSSSSNSSSSNPSSMQSSLLPSSSLTNSITTNEASVPGEKSSDSLSLNVSTTPSPRSSPLPTKSSLKKCSPLHVPSTDTSHTTNAASSQGEAGSNVTSSWANLAGALTRDLLSLSPIFPSRHYQQGGSASTRELTKKNTESNTNIAALYAETHPSRIRTHSPISWTDENEEEAAGSKGSDVTGSQRLTRSSSVGRVKFAEEMVMEKCISADPYDDSLDQEDYVMGEQLHEDIHSSAYHDNNDWMGSEREEIEREGEGGDKGYNAGVGSAHTRNMNSETMSRGSWSPVRRHEPSTDNSNFSVPSDPAFHRLSLLDRHSMGLNASQQRAHGMRPKRSEGGRGNNSGGGGGGRGVEKRVDPLHLSENVKDESEVGRKHKKDAEKGKILSQNSNSKGNSIFSSFSSHFFTTTTSNPSTESSSTIPTPSPPSRHTMHLRISPRLLPFSLLFEDYLLYLQALQRNGPWRGLGILARCIVTGSPALNINKLIELTRLLGERHFACEDLKLLSSYVRRAARLYSMSSSSSNSQENTSSLIVESESSSPPSNNIKKGTRNESRHQRGRKGASRSIFGSDEDEGLKYSTSSRIFPQPTPPHEVQPMSPSPSSSSSSSSSSAYNIIEPSFWREIRLAMRETKEEEDDAYHDHEDEDTTISSFFDAQRRYMTPAQRRLNSTLLHVVLITYSVSCFVFFFGLCTWLRAVLPPSAIAMMKSLAVPITNALAMLFGIGTIPPQEEVHHLSTNNTSTDRQVEWLLFSSG